MNNRQLKLGQNKLFAASGAITGEYVKIDGEDFYKISHSNLMDPFFMTVVSSSDHWMFISSNGALTAGRVNASNALFPYYTDDKIHDSQEITGSKSILQVTVNAETYLWEPFSMRAEGVYSIQRNLYKNIFGNKLIFEEINQDLGLCFRYGWYNSDRFGFIKKSSLENLNEKPCEVELLDGIQNILPSGINLGMQTDKSTLLDAYKKCELLTESHIGTYTLSSIPVDRPEPSESLRATLVWSTGIEPIGRLLCSRQLNAFRKGKTIQAEKDIRAARGAYFIHARLGFEKKQVHFWYIISELNQDAADLARWNHFITTEKNIIVCLEEDIQKGTEALVSIVATADGLQLSADKLSCSRHFSNTLFNVMRGGIPFEPYLVGKNDFISFLETHHTGLKKKYPDLFSSLPEKIMHSELHRISVESQDPELQRLSLEYLPLTFSRRHGDPSRPWNVFSINIRKKDGTKILDYQGNWRDIFQNWDALSLSFPGYIENFITKFVNASTADGYNPYRLTRNGIEWEEHDPHDPWSFIGYWGDHQLIYLLRFLEHSANHHPGVLTQLMDRELFVYANVPYRIRSYDEIVKNPHDTILYDHALADSIKEKVKNYGADGKLVWLEDEKILHVNLAEKILVSLLAKLSNFIPEAGIWLNTQRPEWNDANNALVGNGASMVTVYYLRRFLSFFQLLLKQSEFRNLNISEEVSVFLSEVMSVMAENRNLLDHRINDTNRRKICDLFGKAGEVYRNKIYRKGFTGRKAKIAVRQLEDFTGLALAYVDHTIRANRRSDGLYHAYNLVRFTERNEITIRYLYEMLEGQVAVLSSGFLSAKEAMHVLNALRASSMYVADRRSYLLYPDRELKHFDEKNLIPDSEARKSELIQHLIDKKDDRLISIDVEGKYHFNPSFRNGKILSETLDHLEADGLGSLINKEREQILALYEACFDHQSFTGRSGAFYGYEGLNSIYWHMVSKLLLALNEIILQLPKDSPMLAQFLAHYAEIREGIGSTKTPSEYGAFPTDPYSHTPGYGGARQPGLTGQVKEDVLSRFGELGIQVKEGCICFNEFLFSVAEFLQKNETFHYYDLQGNLQSLEIPAGSIACTYGQIPIVIQKNSKKNLILHFSDGSNLLIQGLSLDAATSQGIFNRDGKVKMIHIHL